MKVNGGSDERGEEHFNRGVSWGFGGPEDRALQAAPTAGHHHHCPLCCHLRRGLLGICGVVRQEQGGVVPLFPGPSQWIFPNGVPSHDTFGDVFSRLDPDQFQECFLEWSQGLAELFPGEVVAVDGKTVRRSHDKRAGKQAIHLISAWASANAPVSEYGAGED